MPINNKSKNLKHGRLGATSINKQGLIMKVVEYIDFYNVIVEFPATGYKRNTTWQLFIKGVIRDPYHPSIHGIGYLGEGKYKSKINGKHTRKYTVWFNIFRRCYDSKFQDKNPSYKDVTVCKEWFNFQNFAKWYDENYYEIPNELMQLDKDILIKGNKIYSPEACVFVPRKINNLLISRKRDRGNFAIGVCYSNGKYLAQSCNADNKSRGLGYFGSEIEAFNAYKYNKELYIKQTADSYKNLIPEKLYEALYNYTVEIND